MSSLALAWSCVGPVALAELLARADIAGVSGLDLGANKLGPEGARMLAASPQLAGLRSLELYFNAIEAAGVEALAKSPHLVGLTTLGLRQNAIGAAGVSAIARAPWRLHGLDLSINDLDAKLDKLVGAPALRELAVLDISSNQIAAPAIARLLATLPRLEELTLSNNWTGAGLARAIVDTTSLVRLRKLDLSQTDLEGDEIAALLTAPHLGELTELRLALALVRSRSGGTAAVAAIVRSPLRKLEHLDLSNCRIAEAGIAALARWPGLATVRHLDLSHNMFGDGGGRALAASKYLGGIVELDVRINGMAASLEASLRRAVPAGATLRFVEQIDSDDR